MKTLSTPGSWHHKDGTVYSDEGHVVSSVIGTRYHANYEDRIKEREANGRLLASSRSMLKCLVELLRDSFEGVEFKHEQVLAEIERAAPEVAAEMRGLLMARESA